MIQPIAYNQATYVQPLQNPNYYASQLYKSMSQNLEDIHKKYYPDLAADEFGLPQDKQNELLYKRNKLLQLAKYGTPTNYEITYNNIKDNKDFKELIDSKYLNNAQGFMTLLSSMASLEAQRAEKITTPIIPYYPNALVSYVPHLPYEKYNINDYLQMLNNFVKNPKISDDLKQYFLMMKSDKLDVYYTRLNKINTASDPLKVLTENNAYSKE